MKNLLINIAILTAIFFGSSCAVKFSTPSISNLLAAERALINPFKPEPCYEEILNITLTSVLKELDLPSDYAAIKTIDTFLPTMYSGISKEIYVSTSLIENIHNERMSINNFRMLLIHEIIHKKLNHPYRALSDLEISLKIQEPDLTLLTKTILMSNSYRKKKDDLSSFKDYYEIYSSANRKVDPDSEYTPKYFSKSDIMTIPLMGYTYPIDYEFDVDDMVIEMLKKNNESPSMYIDSLVLLKNLLKIYAPKSNTVDILNLDHRINRLRT